MTYYAIMHNSGEVIASGSTYIEASIDADLIGVWDKSLGTVAPYYFTTIEPKFCSVCNGNGKISDGYELWDCQHCNGTGYSSCIV